MPRISNIAKRNVSLMFATALSCGLIYCVYNTVHKGESWIALCPIILSTAIFINFYLSYRKEIRKGNMYGKVNIFK